MTSNGRATTQLATPAKPPPEQQGRGRAGRGRGQGVAGAAAVSGAARGRPLTYDDGERRERLALGGEVTLRVQGGGGRSVGAG